MRRLGMMISNEKGAAKVKMIIAILFVFVIVSSLLQVVPRLYTAYEIGLAFENTLRDTKVDMPDAKIREVLELAFDAMEVPPDEADASEVVIERAYEDIYLSLDYKFSYGIPGTALSHPIVIHIEK